IVKGVLPNKLKTIKFGSNFNQPLIDVLPKSLEAIKFGKSFDNKINSLPVGLKYIKFGFNFNQKISRQFFPNSINTIIFGDEFNNPLDDVLPDNLSCLKLGWEFNKPIKKLPDNLKLLIVNGKY